jgi:DNA-binding beta-propeller fold protein YncE
MRCMRRRSRQATLVCSAFIAACAPTAVMVAQPAQQSIEAPLFEVDPLWPQPLPNHWLIGSVLGVAVDGDGRVYVLNRRDSFNARTEIGAASNPPTGDCCRPAPSVLVFDRDGALVTHWGGPGDGYAWPTLNHRLTLDAAGNVWIGGVDATDAHALRFSRDGRFLGQLGQPRQEGAAPGTFRRIAKVSFDAARNIAYVADHDRVLVIEPATGAVRATWHAYATSQAGAAPGAYDPAAPPARQFRNVQCAEPSTDGLVYVCDRESNRIQVFRTDGTYVTEKLIAPETLGTGAVWDIALSRDADQAFMYVADGSNMKVHVLDRRSLDVLTSFGTGGRQPGQFYAVHSIATDSRGNIYTAETYEGKRIQKFVFRGVGPVPAQDQGTVWPRR